jgi:hypothetical protein
VNSVPTIIQELLDEVKELALTDVEITEESRTARSRLADIGRRYRLEL